MISKKTALWAKSIAEHDWWSRYLQKAVPASEKLKNHQIACHDGVLVSDCPACKELQRENT